MGKAHEVILTGSGWQVASASSLPLWREVGRLHWERQWWRPAPVPGRACCTARTTPHGTASQSQVEASTIRPILQVGKLTPKEVWGKKTARVTLPVNGKAWPWPDVTPKPTCLFSTLLCPPGGQRWGARWLAVMAADFSILWLLLLVEPKTTHRLKHGFKKTPLTNFFRLPYPKKKGISFF